MAFKKFARCHAGIFFKYNCSVRKHTEEGICMPARGGWSCVIQCHKSCEINCIPSSFIDIRLANPHGFTMSLTDPLLVSRSHGLAA